MHIISVNGQYQNGKDTIADYLAKLLGWGRAAFAKGVKQVFCDTFGTDMAFVEYWKTRPECPAGFSMPVRQALQFIGDGFRQIQPRVWLEKPFRNQSQNIIISDGRYNNELVEVRTRGGVNILVYRPGFLNDDPNGSEAQLRPILDYLIETGVEGEISAQLHDMPAGVELVDIFLHNDGTVADLYSKVDQIVQPYVLKKFVG